MALALNNLKKVDMPLNKKTNYALDKTSEEYLPFLFFFFKNMEEHCIF